MSREIASLAEVASSYDAIVLDQWGVLHDGSRPYPGAIEALLGLKQAGVRLAVLSNSGKRAASNAARITSMGFPDDLFDVVMTSGEALWLDINAGKVAGRRFVAIERTHGDAAQWADGLDVKFTADIADADGVCLMGLPDGSELSEWSHLLEHALARGLTVVCSNPDLNSPRAGGKTVVSPGALAEAYEERGGTVVYYGKPHVPIFSTLSDALGTENLVMVGDSLDHDIAGAHSAGWDSVLVEGGLYAADFARGDREATVKRLCNSKHVSPPTYRIRSVG